MTLPGDRRAILATLPIVIYLAVQLLEWAWSPVLFDRAHYTVWGTVLIGITAPGALIGVRKRLPPWSYAWVVFAIWEAQALIGAWLAEDAESLRQLGLVLTYSAFTAYLAILTLAAVVGARRFQHAVLVVLLAFLYGTLSFPIIEPGFGLGQPAAAIATSVFAALAMVQAAIAAAVVYRVVQDPTRDIRMALWLLSGIVISGPMLNSWSGYLGLADTNLSLPFMITVAATFTNAVLIAVRGGLVCLNSVARSDKWNHATVG